MLWRRLLGLTGLLVVAAASLPWLAASPPTLFSPRPLFITHAFGETEGAQHSNSLAAFTHSVFDGSAHLEVDLALDGNGTLLCFHTRHEKFLALPTPLHVTATRDVLARRYAGRLPVMTLAELLAWLSCSPPVWLITDTKEWTPAFIGASALSLRTQLKFSGSTLPWPRRCGP